MGQFLEGGHEKASYGWFPERPPSHGMHWRLTAGFSSLEWVRGPLDIYATIHTTSLPSFHAKVTGEERGAAHLVTRNPCSPFRSCSTS